jgi:Regulator of chromosome condensation (RCC1) repeat
MQIDLYLPTQKGMQKAYLILPHFTNNNALKSSNNTDKNKINTVFYVAAAFVRDILVRTIHRCASMMLPPPSKKKRIYKQSPGGPPLPPRPFQTRMHEHKRLRFQCINEVFESYLKTNPNNEMLQRAMNEYLRLAGNFECKYDCTTKYCDSVLGFGSNEASQLTLTMGTKSDENLAEEEEEEEFYSNKLPEFIPLLPVIRMVSSGGLHSVALSTNGVPITWGNGDKGALGRTVTDSTQEGQPLPVTGFYTYPERTCEDGNIVQIVAGDSHTLFLSINGNVYQCGAYLDIESREFGDAYPFNGDDNQNGTDSNSSNRSVCKNNPRPVHVHQLTKKALAIFAGGGFNAAILEDETLVTWGELLIVLVNARHGLRCL